MHALSPQINIAYPPAGTQKKIEIDDDSKLYVYCRVNCSKSSLPTVFYSHALHRRIFLDKRLAQEVEGDALGEV